MAVRLSPRLRVLRTLNEAAHRFPKIRRFTMGLTLAIVYVVPLAGLARFDLWDGRHLAAGSRTNFVYGFGAVFLAVVGFYLVTFLINAFVGRLFCGFGCPIGHMSRLGDDLEIAAGTGEKRFGAQARAVVFALALGLAGFLWFVDPHVFLEGSRRAIVMATFGIAATTAAIYLLGRHVRWAFCRGYCPIGIYYSAVQTAHSFGIHIDEVSGECKGCDVCTQVCPVGLHPRDLGRPLNDLPGIAIDGFPEANHCLTCGECVRACEGVFKRKPDVIVPLTLSRKPDARKPDARKPDARKPDGETIVPARSRKSMEPDKTSS